MWQFFPSEPGVASPQKIIAFSESQIFVPWKRGSNTSNRSKANANATFFGQIKQQRDLLKMALRLGFLKSNCLIQDVVTSLNCHEVSADSSYKVFTRKIQNDPNT
jgi:hypothetical protein